MVNNLTGAVKMEIFYPVDRVISDNVNPNLPIMEIQELNQQMNCNFEFSDEDEDYFNVDNMPEHVSIIDETELLMRDLECDAY